MDKKDKIFALCMFSAITALIYLFTEVELLKYVSIINAIGLLICLFLVLKEIR